MANAPMPNPLVSDRFVDFLLYEVLDAPALCALPAFAEHGKETFDLWLSACRRLSREVMFPAYRAMDESPPRLVDGQVQVHPAMRALWKELRELGVIASTRPTEVGGQQLPLTVSTLASAYLMAGNLSAYGYAGLTTGAAHLIEAFGDEATRRAFMEPLYAGRWTGTMTLTEPQAGSSLADVQTRATPDGKGGYRLKGAKIFISGGDHDVTENVVHLVLARIDGAPPGTKGISLFAVPKKRVSEETGALVDNDVSISGVIHKIGWRGLPSVALALGDRDDCHGWLLGAPGSGLRCMFQMMNEARLMVGVNGAATASVAYHESLAYARERTQGRPLGVVDATTPPVALTEHPDVRRMLLRQKAIVEGALALLATSARYADLSEHATDPAVRERSRLLLDLLTPIAKSVPAELGYQSNVLAVQIHGGYGYSSEYLPEAWLRDQKLNSIHEGTTGIQSLDLLGRKAVAGGGAALRAWREEILADCELADARGVDRARTRSVRDALDRVVSLTGTLGMRGMQGDATGMLGHSVDYLELASILALAWMWTKLAAHAAGRDDAFSRGIDRAAMYWIATEVPRIAHLASLCESGERSYLELDADDL